MEHELTPRGAGELVALAQMLLICAPTDAVNTAMFAEAQPHLPPRVKRVLRAAVGSAGTGDAGWGLAEYGQIVSAFVDGLRASGIFDRLLGDAAMRRVPLRTRLGVIVVGATAQSTSEGAPKPVTRVALSAEALDPVKASTILAVTDELVRMLDGAAMATLSRELRAAVTAATDSVFLGSLLLAAPSAPSAGFTSGAVLADVRNLLNMVTPTATSRLYLVADPGTARALATMAGADERPAFPGVGPLGGEIANMPLLVSDQLAPDSDGGRLVLIDAAGIAGGYDTITLAASRAASLQLDDAPADGAHSATSLWQTNSRALRAERYFGFKALRENAAAGITGTNYGTTLS